MNHTAEIISVGTELLLGNVTNTDARDISEILSELGINVFFHTVVGDNPQRLKSAVEIAKSRADIIITTGGLGPTCDDLTKQTLAECFGKKLVFDEKEAETLRSYFTARNGLNMTENNYQQAYLPEGCVPFHNTCGTAPGCAFFADGVHVLMLPGPPRECMTMFRLSAVPYLSKLSDSLILSHNIRVFGMGESAMEDKLRPLMLKLNNPTLAPYAKDGECMCRLTAKAKTAEEAEELMAPILKQVRDILGSVIYGVDTESLEATVLELLKSSGRTIATAESCTGGLITKRLTDVPGASFSLLGGITAYSNSTKTSLLGVSEDTIKKFGAVSEETAKEMALCALKKFGADIALSTTGIAGPDSDESGQPVGTVFAALATESGVFCRRLKLGSDRVRIRTSAANHAFDMVRRYLTGLDIETIN